jgi:hypothetical protein
MEVCHDPDVGPANIKLKTAAELMGVTRTDDMNLLAKQLTTPPGVANVTSILVNKAQQQLAPFIQGKPKEEQAQIIVDYIRKGPEEFWQLTQQHRHMRGQDFKSWRADPMHFTLPDGTRPAPMQPNPKNFIQEQFEQLGKSLPAMPTATPRWYSPYPNVQLSDASTPLSNPPPSSLTS